MKSAAHQLDIANIIESQGAAIIQHKITVHVSLGQVPDSRNIKIMAAGILDDFSPKILLHGTAQSVLDMGQNILMVNRTIGLDGAGRMIDWRHGCKITAA